MPLEDYSGAKETIPGMKIRPYLKPVIKGTAAQKLAADIDKIAAALRGDGCGVYAGNIGQIQMFASRGIDVYADYGINTTNSQAAAACRELGAAGAAPSLEHASSDDGAYPLMLTEHRFGPVSYTHLDVYKRQSQSQPVAAMRRQGTDKNGGVQSP